LKTSGTILQTALCYLEAIQSKVPKLLSLERQGLGVKGEPTPASQIVPTTEAEIEYEAGCCSSALTSSSFGTMCGLCSQLSEGHLQSLAVAALMQCKVTRSGCFSSHAIYPSHK